MFLHGGIFHIVFNMLALWMFGAELERTWGTRYFLKFYFVTGIGAGVLTVLFSLLPFAFARQLQDVNIIGASGAIYGLLLAYAIYFPERPILLIVFWVPARLCVTILGAIAVFASLSEAGGVANATHLGGLLVGYLYLKGAGGDPISEMKYRYLKWKINRRSQEIRRATPAAARTTGTVAFTEAGILRALPPAVRSNHSLFIVALAILFFGSGVCALIYQLLWLRMMGWVFGVTVYAASTVWASFMAGLAVGSLAAGVIGDRVRHPLRWFGVTELLIGATALATPAILSELQKIYVAFYPSLPHALAGTHRRAARHRAARAHRADDADGSDAAAGDQRVGGSRRLAGRAPGRPVWQQRHRRDRRDDCGGVVSDSRTRHPRHISGGRRGQPGSGRRRARAVRRRTAP